MFQRFVVKGPCLLLGLMTVLMSAPGAGARTVVSRTTASAARSKPSGSVRVTPSGAPTATRPRPAAPAPATSPSRARPMVPPAAARPAASSEAISAPRMGLNALLQSARAKRPARKQNDDPPAMGIPPQIPGVLDYFVFNVTNRPGKEIEPEYVGGGFPGSENFLYSANVGPSSYPGFRKEAPPLNEPAWLDDRDYRLVYAQATPFGYNFRTIQPVDTLRGEFFEPTTSRDIRFEGDRRQERRVAFSAFLPGDNDAYDPELPEFFVGEDKVDFDLLGVATRVIAYSDDAIQKTLNGDPMTIAKALPAAMYGFQESSVPDPDGGDPEVSYQRKLVPDGSPTIYPRSARFIVFVSLRSDASEDYHSPNTSLWLWDTEAEFSWDPDRFGVESLRSNPRRIYAEPGVSILHPKFSPDGRYLAFTKTDLTFEETTDEAGNEVLPDFVYPFDVTNETLKQPFKAKVWVTPINIANNGSVSGFQDMQQFTDFMVDDVESRDMMPFFSRLNQLGFSSDRVDSDLDGVGDSVAASPEEAKFDIYTIPTPLTPEDSTFRAYTAMRQTLEVYDDDGVLIPDTSHELNGTWGPLLVDSEYSNALSLFAPQLLFQTQPEGDEDGDIWGLVRNVFSVLQGNTLIGLPEVTPKPEMPGAPYVQPGDPINIAVRLAAPTETTRVFALIKDPDLRVYDQYDRPVNSSIVTTVFREVDAEMVRLTPDDLAHWEDNYGSEPGDPQYGYLVELTPDEARKNGWYSGVWATALMPSDYLMDIFILETETGQVTTNDNIGGFTTSTFIPYSQSLLVSDFAIGQKTVAYTTQTATTAGVATESYFTARPAPDTGHQVGAFTSKPVVSIAGPYGYEVMGPRIEWLELPTVAVNPNTGRLDVGWDGTPNYTDELFNFSTWGNYYDLWRTQCREPISMEILKNYLPYMISQPGYPIPANKRSQRIADRVVLWMAPHAGQLNGNAGSNSQGIGTIANLQTQTILREYLQKNGRMALAGDDVAFALSQEGAIKNHPLLAIFKVDFLSHFNRDILTVYNFQRARMSASRPGNEGENTGLNPIPYATWEVHYGNNAEPTPTTLELAPWISPLGLGQPTVVGHPVSDRLGNLNSTREDGAWTNLYIDNILGLDQSQPSGARPVYTYNDGTLAAAQASIPTGAENTSRRKTVFYAFGIEGINRNYREVGPDGDMSVDHIHYQNPAATMIHNMIDWMTTGAIAGKVSVVNDQRPVKDALVWVIDDWNAEEVGKLKGTALTEPDGTYIIEGLDSSLYRIYAYKTGYAFQNPNRVPVDSELSGFAIKPFDPITLFVAGVTSDTNLLLIPVQPGTLRGKIVDQETGNPIPGVTITIRDITGTTEMTATTDEEGNYQINSVPAGLYLVSIPVTIANGISYAAFQNDPSNPLSVATDPVENDPQGDTVYNVRLQRRVVPPEPATLEVTVLDDSADTPVPGVAAVVSVFDANTNQLLEVSEDSPSPNPGITGDDGKVTFRIKAGQVNIRVEYSAYKVQTRSIVVQPDEGNPMGKTTATFRFGGVLHVFPPDVVLMASAPYSYAGSSASPLRFSDILGLPETQLKNAIVAFNSTAQEFVFFPTYPADTFHPGFGYGMKLPAEGRILEAGEPVPSTGGYYVVRANIGWNLIGNPYPGDIVWSKKNAGGGKNVKFSLRDDATRTLHDIGDTNDPVTVSNILTGDILWGATETDEHGNGIYRGNYSNAHTVLKPWQAYWIKVAQPVLLYYPRTEAPQAVSPIRLMSAATAPRASIVPDSATWSLDITATSGKLKDSGLGLGLSRNATQGVDPGLDLPKPGPMSASVPMLFTAIVQPNGGFLATDVRGGVNNDWNFMVNTNLNVQNITLTWKTSGQTPAGSTLVLVDTATGRRTNMGTANQYTFRSARTGGIRRFRVELRGASTVRPR